MAFLRLSGLLTSMTGKLNGSYFSQKKGGTTMNRCGSKLTKADSGRQSLQLAQNTLGFIARKWSTLAPEDQLTWVTFAGTLTWLNKAGMEYTPSGYEVFMSCNLNKYQLTGNYLVNPVISSADGDISAAGVGWNLAGQMIFKYPPATPTNQGVILFATAPQSSGVARPKGGYKMVFKSDSFESGDTIIGSGYQNAFGTPSTAGVIFFKIVFIDPESGIQNGSKLTKADSGFL